MSDLTFKRPISWRSSAITDVGCVRKVNEDAVLNLPRSRLWAVADGMGGHAIGEIASDKVINGLKDVKLGSRLADNVEVLEYALTEVNQHIIGYADIMFDSATMGSTVALMHSLGHVGVCLWVGDSRLYRLRNSRLEQLSRDHSQVEQMIRMGLLNPEDAGTYPNSNVITRAIGVEDELFVDINIFSTRIGDTFMLCSDGVYNSVDISDISEGMRIKDPQQSAQELIDKSIKNGARDNISVVIIKGEPGSH